MQELPPGFRVVNAPPVADPVIAPPNPYKEREADRQDRSLDIQARNADLQAQINEIKLGEMRDDKQAEAEQRTRAEAAARSALLKTIRELNNIAIDADDNSGWFETGTSGQVARGMLPGANAGKDLAANIETLNADFAFSALTAMREASKTGGALGQVTERELDLLKASTANIDPNISHEAFLQNVERARQVYLTRLADLDPQLATRLGYDAAKAEESLLALNKEYEARFGDPSAPAPVIDRTGNPNAPQRTPEDIEAIMRKYGIEQ